MHSVLIENIPGLVLILILATAAVIDLRTQRIPNLLTLPSILVALTYYTFVNGIEGFWFSLGGLAAGIGVLLIPYLMGGMGAGDAKLMGAVGAFVGAQGVCISFLLTAVAGGIYAVVILIRKQDKGFLRSQMETLKTFILTRQYIPDAMTEKDRGPRLCYGLAIAIGSMTYMALDFTGYSFPI